MFDAYKRLPDLNSSQKNPKIMMRMTSVELGCLEFEVLTNSPLSYQLCKKMRQLPWMKEVDNYHPNLKAYLDELYNKRMDDEGLLQEETSYPVLEYFSTLTKDQTRSIAEG
eukprot:CAMPEP_0170501638 /NCGR_PEP_ID=MMETSP0208-20121228/38952_1 /TAXON_ID=197538 /ORGANISM="Strombidium inclinatum, Strain S3" /LENGTH=110 /DNA_ID=CAMNT_0010780295 /DNA_START=908 /DNA_END=1240 /DNA_ORIENTATION=+